ncbi:MAG: CapA family protein [Actinobacteria bacterium]|nr:CapA family protein [Actinomycetota bacterium]
MRAVLLALRAGAVVVAFGFFASLLVDGSPRAEPASGGRTIQATKAPATKKGPRGPLYGRAGVAGEVISFVAVGDIVMGTGTRLPPKDGRTFFEDVGPDLAGDVVIGNLEGTLSRGGSSKCGAGSSNCFAFQSPPRYARHLVDAGFTIVSLANNHTFDYGRGGMQQTIAALDAVGLPHTGRPGQITTLTVNGVRINVVGFAPYPWAQSLTDISGAARLVRKADETSALVVVVFHGGAEGASQQHVRPGTEMFLGENRGDLKRFARAVIDAGADLVVGSGPHVLRGMEWYKDRLIAYSLGDFGGYDVFSMGGPLSISAILRVEIRGDGTFESGMVVPTIMVGKGIPARDPTEQAHEILRSLSREDFGENAVRISPAGLIPKG